LASAVISGEATEPASSSGAHYFDRVDYAGADKILVLAGRDVQA
jgi:hypothetical protein